MPIAGVHAASGIARAILGFSAPRDNNEHADIGDMPQIYVGGYGGADPTVIRRLREVYAEPNRRLSNLLDMKLSWPTD